MNGNQAAALGAIAAGMEICAMYPITPATSVSHELSDVFETYGGMVHQAEDEIAAAGVALGASYGGKVALTVTSGPGHGAQDGISGAGHHGRDPTGRSGCPAWRAVDGIADQSGAVRSYWRRFMASRVMRHAL